MTKPTILVATWSDGVFAVTGDGCTQELANQPVRGLAADGSGSALAIVGPHSLRRRAQSGKWATVATSEFDLSCCMAVRDTIYVGTNDARMLRLNHVGDALETIDSFDSVAGRDTWFAGSAIVNGQRVGPPLGIRSVAANSDGSVLFANVHVGGIPRSIDGGKNWHPTIDINNDVHEVRVHLADPQIVAAAAAVGLCISRDSGATWSIEQEGLHALHCSAVAFSGDDILVSAAASPFAAEGRIYRRRVKPDGSKPDGSKPDGSKPDGSIVAIEGGLPTWLEGSPDTGCIAVNGSSVAIVDRGGNVYSSDDFGRTWSCLSIGLPTPSGVLIY